MCKHVLGTNISVLGQETLNEIGLIGTHGILKHADEIVKSNVEQNTEDPSKFRNPGCIKDKNCRLLLCLYKYANLCCLNQLKVHIYLSSFTYLAVQFSIG